MKKRKTLTGMAILLCALFVLAFTGQSMALDHLDGDTEKHGTGQESQSGMQSESGMKSEAGMQAEGDQKTDMGMQAQGMAQAEEPTIGARLYISPAGVRQVQLTLNQKGFTAGNVDGMWGSNTRDAVMQFQKAQGLEPTGNLNMSTIQQLGLSQMLSRSGEQQGQAQQEQAQQGQAQQGKQFVVGQAQGGVPLYVSPSDLKQLQQQLKQQGFDVGSVDGQWGPTTQGAIRNYEEAQGLEPTGNVNLRLISSLGLNQMVAGLTGGQGQQGQQQQAQQAQQGQQQQAQQGQQAQQDQQQAQAQQDQQQQQQGRGYYGQQGQQADQAGEGAPLHVSPEGVRQIEQALNQVGFSTGNIDGEWDQQTSQAAMNYQEANGLAPTGNLTVETMQNLVGSANIDLMGGQGQSGQQQGQTRGYFGDQQDQQQQSQQQPQQDQQQQQQQQQNPQDQQNQQLQDASESQNQQQQ